MKKIPRAFIAAVVKNKGTVAFSQEVKPLLRLNICHVGVCLYLRNRYVQYIVKEDWHRIMSTEHFIVHVLHSVRQ